MRRSCGFGLLTSIIGLIGSAQAIGQQLCRPALAITEVQFSEVQPSTMERRWSAVVSVDASRCAKESAGYFEIGFARLKENALDIEFSEEFVWLPPSVKVSVDFWVDEAIERHWINKVSACPCAR